MLSEDLILRGAIGPMIHPLALIQDSVVAVDARVWQFASVIRRSNIGNRSVIGAGSVIDASFIGDDCHVGALCNINPGTFISDCVFIGPRVVTCNDPWPSVERGDFDLDEIINGRIIVHVETRASIGAGAILLPGVVIGPGAMIAAGSVVKKSVPGGHLHKQSGKIVPIEKRTRPRMVDADSRDNVMDLEREVMGIL